MATAIRIGLQNVRLSDKMYFTMFTSLIHSLPSCLAVAVQWASAMRSGSMSVTNQAIGD